MYHMGASDFGRMDIIDSSLPLPTTAPFRRFDKAYALGEPVVAGAAGAGVRGSVRHMMMCRSSVKGRRGVGEGHRGLVWNEKK